MIVVSLKSGLQGLHRLEKYLNLDGLLEKSLKIKYALKNSGKSHKGIEKSLIFLFSVVINTVDRDLNQNKTVVPLFGAANAAPNKGTAFAKLIYSTNFPLSQSNISEVEF